MLPGGTSAEAGACCGRSLRCRCGMVRGHQIAGKVIQIGRTEARYRVPAWTGVICSIRANGNVMVGRVRLSGIYQLVDSRIDEAQVSAAVRHHILVGNIQHGGPQRRCKAGATDRGRSHCSRCIRTCRFRDRPRPLCPARPYGFGPTGSRGLPARRVCWRRAEKPPPLPSGQGCPQCPGRV